MKTLLILDKSLGLAKSRLVKNLLGAAAANAGLTLTEQLADAELAIVLGASVQADSGLNGKNVFAGDVELALSQPAQFLEKAKAEAKPYQAPATAAPAAAPTTAKRIVAVTACPTGVAHTFMAAEAIESEAKKTWLVGESGNPRLRRCR
ncbi:hypothetical protein DZS_39280 [Dickeya ananatis]